MCLTHENSLRLYRILAYGMGMNIVALDRGRTVEFAPQA